MAKQHIDFYLTENIESFSQTWVSHLLNILL